MKTNSHRRWLAWLVGTPALAAAVALLAPQRSAHASGADDALLVEHHERCATRVAIAMLGDSPTPAMLTSADPQAAVDDMLGQFAFIDRFSRFLNATFNAAPGDVRAADAPYYLAVKILTEKKPYKEMFVGKYSVELADPTTFRDATVKADPAGLGYFHSPFWEDRYSGNEKGGLRLMTAYRIQNNIVGLDLVAFTAAPGQTVDTTATGRQNPSCSGCHYDHWFALDKVASVLGKVKLDANGKPVMSNPTNNKQNHVVFAAQTAAQQQLYGTTVHNEREVVEALVASPAFGFNTCRIAFKYLYGRPENKCEGPLFDRCVDAFQKDGMIQTAIATIAKDPSFCQ
jgi:hypothetical protein